MKSHRMLYCEAQPGLPINVLSQVVIQHTLMMKLHMKWEVKLKITFSFFRWKSNSKVLLGQLYEVTVWSTTLLKLDVVKMFPVTLCYESCYCHWSLGNVLESLTCFECSAVCTCIRSNRPVRACSQVRLCAYCSVFTTFVSISSSGTIAPVLHPWRSIRSYKYVN